MSDTTASRLIVEVEGKGVNSTATSMNKLDAAILKTGKDSNQTKSDTKALSSSISGIKIAAVAAVAGLVAMGKGALQNASDLEQNEIALTTMLKSADRAKALLQEFRELGATTPFETKDIIKAGKQMVAFGFQVDTVTDNLRMIGDVAAGIGVPLGELSEIYSKIMVSNQVYAEDLNQLAGRGVPIFKELEKVTGKNAAAIKKMASEGKLGFKEIETVFKNLTKEGGTFSGMMAAQSKSLGGLWSTFKSQLDEVSTAIGQKLSPAFKRLLTTLTESKIIIPAIQAVFMGIAGVVTTFVGAIDWAIRAMENFGKSLQAVDRKSEIKGLEQSITALQKNKQAYANQKDGIQTYNAGLKLLKTRLLETKIEQEKYNLSLVKTGKSKIAENVKNAHESITQLTNVIANSDGTFVQFGKALVNMSDGTKKVFRYTSQAVGARKDINKQMALSFKELGKLNKKEKESALNIKAYTKALNALNKVDTSVLPKVTGNFNKNNESAKKLKKTMKDLKSEALGFRAAAGNVEAKLEVLKNSYEKQIKVVKAAGMETNSLTMFYNKQKAEIMNEARLKEEEAQKKHLAILTKGFQDWGGIASNVVSSIAAFSSAATSIEQQALNDRMIIRAQDIKDLEDRRDAEQRAMEDAGATLQERAKAEEVYTKQINEIQDAGAAEQLKINQDKAIADKALGIAQATISGGIAIAKAFELGPIAGPIAAAALGVLTAANIVAIAAVPIPTAQNGGDFIVPPGNPADSGLLRVNQGEQVSVKPVQQSGNSGGTQILKIGEKEFVAYLTDSMNKIANSGNFQINRKGVVRAS